METQLWRIKQAHPVLKPQPKLHGNPGPPNQSLSRELGIVLAGGAAVVIGSLLLVQNAAILARWLGIPELIIALTLVALGTSLPEYVTAFASTLKGHSDLGVGNIIGANFLDIAWVIGFSALVRPLPIERQTQVLDFPVMLVLMGLLVYFGSTNSKIERLAGRCALCRIHHLPGPHVLLVCLGGRGFD
jgi:cation:H+ antiporter